MVIIAKLARRGVAPGFKSFLYGLSALDSICTGPHVSSGPKSVSPSGQLTDITKFGISQLNTDVLGQPFQKELLKEQARVVVSEEC